MVRRGFNEVGRTAATSPVVARFANAYPPDQLTDGPLGPLPIRKFATTARGVTAPIEDDATIDNATAFGAHDLHTPHVDRSALVTPNRSAPAQWGFVGHLAV